MIKEDIKTMQDWEDELKREPSIDDSEEPEEEIDTDNLNIQGFMNDMNLLHDQLSNKDLKRARINLSDGSITNYLLWLLLGEIKLLREQDA